MTKNMGKTDRVIRLTAAIVIALLITVSALKGVPALIFGILAAVLAVTGAVSFCPLYLLLGISTLKKKE